jgi:RNA polymerase sigma-70 factor (ECF subfamily)
MLTLLSPRPEVTEAARLAIADDADLAARAPNDPLAFEALYRRYVDPVHQYCYRRLGTREAAEDATSVIFLKAFSSLPTYRPGSFRSWLFAIAYHVITDRLRATRPEAPLDEAADVPDREPSPEEIVLTAEARRSVAALLAHLPPDQRRVVELRLTGLTGREVAQVLGRSLPAVKIAQVRAYARLRTLLGSAAATEEASRGA